MPYRSVVVLACLVCLALGASANATITSSNITAPANGTHYFITDANPDHSVPLTGTSNGTTGDSVDIRCYTRSDDWAYVTSPSAPIAVAADGSFSTTMMTGNAYGTCIMRAVPHNFPATGDASPFAGPTLTGEWDVSKKVASGPNAGKVRDFYVLFQSSDAMNDYASATFGGLWDSRLQYSNGYGSAYLWFGNAILPQDEGLSSGDRSQLQVDGRNAYGPRSAAELLGGNGASNAGWPELTFDATRDAATGNTTIHETDPIVVCPDPTFPPTAVSCPHFDSAGVRLERTYFADDGGRQVHITDVWRGTDNAVHTISAHYDQLLEGSDPVDSTKPVGIKLPWLGDFATFTTEQVFAGPPSPGAGSIFVRDNNNVPAGSEKYPLGAISFDIAPHEVRRSDNDRFTLRDENISIPAGGTAVVREDFVMGLTQAEVDAKAAANVDRYVSPTVSISSPANGSTVTGAARTKQVSVSGTASDNTGVASLTLNGSPVQLGAGGTFSAPATLVLGGNTLTAVAKDAAGNSTTASATVTYVDNVNPAVTGFRASPARFRVAPGATPVSARAKAGTTFRFTLSEDAKVSIKILRAGKRLVTRGTLRRSLPAGKRKVRFTGRIGKKKLAPGRYVARIVAVDYAGHSSKRKTVRFRVVTR